MKLPTTSGTHKSYKPGQLITICKNVFRIVKNKSSFTDCYMCDLGFREQKNGASIVLITYIVAILS